jgi:hypothetical protein
VITPRLRHLCPTVGLLAVLLLPAARPAFAADAPAALTDAPGRTAFEPTRRSGGDPFARELRAAREAREAALNALRRRLAAASPEGRPAIQREIEATKRGYEAALVQAQFERARRAGRPELAARLERRLGELARDGVSPLAAAPAATPAPPAPAEGGAR